MKSTDLPQDLFHPLVAEWFSTRFETPTEIQRLAWPPIARRANVLVTAPTGTGKTLTVFLSAIDRLIRGESETGAIRVLYISPLKALNNDIRENLTAPLRELKDLFESREVPFPDINAVVRSGDTPQSERQRMLRKPPEILITTPESLNLLLSSPKARAILSTIETVILDEIHAVAAGKRGTHLITAVERLVLLAGEFQRIAVSATVKPVGLIADFVGGYRIERGADGPIYVKRNVEIAQSIGSKKLELKIEYPLKDMQLGGYDTVWNLIAEPVRQIIKEHKSTLIFVNSRRLAENLTHIINQNGEMLAYAHHGSLSRELRHIVEKRLKAGELSAIVATTSLEMGIDIGNLDKVILIQTPFSVSSAVQRIGRAGHTVHQISSGVVFPSHGMDLVHAAVIANLVMEKDVEEVHPVRCPLDILSQILLSMLGIAAWNLDELFTVIRGSYAFHELREKEFRSVLDMLAGRYRDARIRELKPRIMIDEVTNIGRAHNGALHLIYMSGGTIPDRGYFSMRVHGSLSRVGELDEEFVWERKTGDTFTLGTQSWKIMKMDHQKVEVIPWKGPVKIQPFWKAEGVNRDFHYSRKISAFLENWNDRLDDPELPLELQARHALDDRGSDALISFLKHQRKSSGAELPHRHHILVEHSFDPSTGTDLQTVFIHTLWGNRVNYPLALVLAALWERDHYPVEVMSDNDVVVVQLPHDEVFRDTNERSYELPIGELLSSIVIDEIGDLIRSRLEKGAFFGARFRENAGRALLLPRSGVSRRTPLWVNRLKAKKLMEAVRGYQDFPILLETWRTCIQDELDIDSLKMLLEEIGSGEISISEISTTKPSPFADGAIWQSTNKHLYGDDTPVGHDTPSVDPNVLKEAVFSPHIRPALDTELVRFFSAKLGRTEEGYSPRGPEELTDWVGERLLIPLEQWNRLLEAMERDHGLPREELLEAVASRCGLVQLPGAAEVSVVSLSGLVRLIISLDLRIDDIKITPIIESYDTTGFRKDLARLLDKRKSESSDLNDDYSAESVLSQWLVYSGPVPVDSISMSFGLAASDVNDLLSLLTESKIVVVDRLTEGAEVEEVCDAENLERILGFSRRQKRSGVQESFDPLPPRELQPFLARWQRLSRRGKDKDDLKRLMLPLLGLGVSASRWEEDVLPARMDQYQSFWLDELLQSVDFEWTGCGREQLAFSFTDDAELFFPPVADSSQGDASVESFFPDILGRYSFWDLRDRSNLTTAELSDFLWRQVWAGRVRCDSFDVVRKGALRGFKRAETEGPKDPRLRRRSAGLSQWRASRPISGNWSLVPKVTGVDLLEEAELGKDRARILLQRYGVVFRELLARELPALRWAGVFRSLRIMELSGEVVGGHFFTGVGGIQFAAPAALRDIRDNLDSQDIFWMNAADPASLCGVDIAELKAFLPERYPSTYLVFHGPNLVIVARKHGADLEIKTEPGNPELARYVNCLKTLMTRSYNPRKSLKVKTINGEDSTSCRYTDFLEGYGFIRDYQGLSLWPV